MKMAKKTGTKWKKYTAKQLNNLLEARRGRAVVHCKFVRPHAGGIPADEKGVCGFVEHHLKLVPETKEFKEAVKRIMEEEIGSSNTTPEEGELEDEHVYQLNVIRRNGHGPYLLEHMIKAAMKVAASKLGIFQAKRGSKGDMAEVGTVLAYGKSLQNPQRPWEIYLHKKGKPVKTHYQKIQGSVNTPKGRKSVQHHTEITEEGVEFSFEFRWMENKLKASDIPKILATARVVGIGSCRSLGYGEFEVLSLEVAN
jgi:hypothetical protein